MTGTVRATFATFRTRFVAEFRTTFARRTVRSDAKAGLVLGLEAVPDGLAAGLLAGVNPVAGLYSYLVGTVTGALTTSSVFMSVTATGAMAVLIADVPQLRGASDSGVALVTLTVLTGAIMLTAGVLRWGSLVRFVPNSVLTGFINAVAINIVLGQFGNFTGFASDAGRRITRAADTALNITSFDWPTVAIGTATLVLIVLLERTRLGALGLVAAVVATSSAVVLLGWDSVAQLRDIAEVPDGLPTPVLPSLSLVLPLLVPALSLAFLGLIQGAAISRSIVNPDGTYPDVSGDFRGQGIANLAVGTLQGMPVGGSMSSTALVTTAGARTRLANIVAGVVIAVVILAFGGTAGYIAMPALAGLLILIGLRTFKLDQVLMVWRTGKTQATVMFTTFALTMVIPLQYAVLVGVGISVIMFVARQSNKVTVVRWVYEPDSHMPFEEPPPAELPAHEVVVLTAYGSLFFASAPVVEAQLPVVTEQSQGSVVVLQLRGKEDLGSTFIRVLTKYALELQANRSHLLLAGIDPRALRQLTNTGALDVVGADNVFPATPRVGEALAAAQVRANRLLDGTAP